MLEYACYLENVLNGGGPLPKEPSRPPPAFMVCINSEVVTEQLECQLMLVRYDVSIIFSAMHMQSAWTNTLRSTCTHIRTLWVSIPALGCVHACVCAFACMVHGYAHA